MIPDDNIKILGPIPSNHIALDVLREDKKCKQNVRQFQGAQTVYFPEYVNEYEPRHEKTCLRGFRPGRTQTDLLRYRD